jgi:hypothetical protein
MTAYDAPISVSSVYLFNLYNETMKEEVVEPRKDESEKVRRKRKKLST